MRTQRQRLLSERFYGGDTMDGRKNVEDLTLREILEMIDERQNNQREINITINYDYSNSIIMRR